MITERWAEETLYLLNCDASWIEAHRPGKQVEDFCCPSCDRRTQLKATRGGHGPTVSNSAYDPKMDAIEANQAPDYAVLGFDPDRWRVTDPYIVPGHFTTPRVVGKRAPSSEDARRSGWAGSNIRLEQIPGAGRIQLVENGDAIDPDVARGKFAETAFLTGGDAEARDWTTAVRDCIDDRSVEPGDRFELAVVYGFEDRLAEMYPDTQHIRPKIRQQLQALRDQEVLEFPGGGDYRRRWIDDRDPT